MVLQNEKELLYGFNADKFIEDLVGRFSSEHLENLDVSTPPTPVESRWVRRWANGGATEKTLVETPKDELTYNLQQDLEKIWQTTPTQTA